MPYARRTLFVAFAYCACAEAKTASTPNIVLIVADDLGWADVGFNGCPDIPTPHLDRLAEAGVVFDAGYVSHPYCSPSRAGLLSGRYQQSFGHESNPPYAPDDRAIGMPASEQTLAESLQQAGYRTAAIGKWHLGDAEELLPPQQGFDTWYGFSGGNMSYWGDPPGGVADRGVVRGSEPVDRSELSYLTDDFSVEAARFVANESEQPFFLYLAYNAPHAPDHVTPEHLEKTAHIEYGGRSVYGGMVAAMDDGIGMVLNALSETGRDRNTLVIFLSDNGGRIENASNGPYRGHKGMLFEGGIRVAFCLAWPGKIPGGWRSETPVSALDLYPTALAAAGATDQAPQNLAGENLLPELVAGELKPSQRSLFWRYCVGPDEYGYAIRKGNWKYLYSSYKERDFLFNLADDPGERIDRLRDSPDVVANLRKAYEAWAAEVIDPKWTDPHGVNVKKEEKNLLDARSKAARGASQ